MHNTPTSILDVRSPSEFAEDHIPNAINVPVLSDQERTHVGRLHADGDILKARIEGAALICANLSSILKDMSEKLPPARDVSSSNSNNILIYCFRGGQRSNSLATLLTQIGWPSAVGTLVGGYQSWRRLVIRQLNAWPVRRLPGNFWIVSGLTGSGKSLVLSELANVGESVIDLEQLANHKGSIFGASLESDSANNSLSSNTPATQRQFESSLHRKLTTDARLQTASAIWIECESRCVGPFCRLPHGLWMRMRSTDPGIRTHRILLEVPEEARVEWILQSYAEYTKSKATLNPLLECLSTYHSSKRIAQWRAFVECDDFRSFVTGLLRHHYDPLYSKSRAHMFHEADQHGMLHKLALPTVDLPTIRSRLIPTLIELSRRSRLDQRIGAASM